MDFDEKTYRNDDAPNGVPKQSAVCRRPQKPHSITLSHFQIIVDAKTRHGQRKRRGKTEPTINDDLGTKQPGAPRAHHHGKTAEYPARE
ncbi:MAG: hypothetical protein LBI87_06010 [Candidatus Accumulibacter sp.]|jgi:hypothetical protein|nr:hypothetical protein [Accumulibacter sp.]